MKITILTYGSRGDVQPFLPFSLGLMARGHSVKLAAPRRFKDLVEEHGVHFVPLAGDPEDLSRRLNNVGFNPFKQMREMMDHAIAIGADVARQVDEACRDAELIIHTFAHAVGAHTAARENHIPDVHIQTFPMFTPTGDYPNVALPDLKLRALNYFSHVFSSQISKWTSKFGYEQVRRRAGLPKRKLHFPFDKNPPFDKLRTSLRPPTLILCAWSPSVLPPSREWGKNVHVTGYFFFDFNEAYKPPDELRSFLNSGEKPICISFGSMVNRDAKRIDEIIRESLRRTNHRGIILSGWGMVNQPLSSDLLYLESAPHDWLLPRCKMIVHHGGAGTTSAGLRAGIPQVVVPFMTDQPFWARRVHALDVAPKPILVKNLTVDRLVKAIAEAATKAARVRADEMGRKIRAEDGVNRAVALVESHVRDWHETAIF